MHGFLRGVAARRPCAAQWVDFGFPDPAGVQYPVMVSGVTQVAAKNKWPIDNVYIWVDYSSIPQVCTAGHCSAEDLTLVAHYPRVRLTR